MSVARIDGGELYYEDKGGGVPIVLIHPAGATSSTWGAVVGDLARTGRVIAYDRRGCGQSGGEPVRSIQAHAADAAALLDILGAAPAVVAGISVAATIAIEIAYRRPDLVRAVVAHESPWQVSRHPPTRAEIATLSRMGWLALRGKHADAAETFLRFAYGYRDGGTAWDAFPEAWRRTARENAKAALADVRMGIGGYPPAAQLATIKRPVVLTCGTRSRDPLRRVARSLAAVIPGAQVHEIDEAGHAAAFDAPANFARVIAEATRPA
ncbi:MAG: alpha/beta hydrolase [Nocardiopsaceae bacterium]|jgi:pimeloyl-ACP methyl ester carboxylesterase|nr:alpha/beta hydrolase [Nocardiopsaceae bacterium]